MSTKTMEGGAAAPPPATTLAARKLDPRIVVGGALLLSGLGTAGWYIAHTGRETTDNAQIQCDVVGIPARVGGVVERIHFEDNQLVPAGFVLAELDPASQRARLAQAEAELASARMAALAAAAETELAVANARGDRELTDASVDVASATHASTRREIEQAAAMVRAAVVTHRRAADALARERRLLADGATSQEAVDTAQDLLDTAEAELAAARARRSMLSSSRRAAASRVTENEARAELAEAVEDGLVARARAQQRLAEARVLAVQAARDAAALELAHTTIVTPRAGVASNRAIAAGQMVGVGQPIVDVVTCAESAWVEANFKETQLAHMRPGQRASIEVDAYPGLVLAGEVESLSGGTGATFSLLPPENATGNFTKVVQRIPVRIRLLDVPDETPLRAGMSVVATVESQP